jgi:hypothetical protein
MSEIEDQVSFSRPPSDVVARARAHTLPGNEFGSYMASPHVIINYRFDSRTPPEVRHATLKGKEFTVADLPPRHAHVPVRNQIFLANEKAKAEAEAYSKTEEFKEIQKAEPVYRKGVMLIVATILAFTAYFLYAI